MPFVAVTNVSLTKPSKPYAGTLMVGVTQAQGIVGGNGYVTVPTQFADADSPEKAGLEALLRYRDEVESLLMAVELAIDKDYSEIAGEHRNRKRFRR